MRKTFVSLFISKIKCFLTQEKIRSESKTHFNKDTFYFIKFLLPSKTKTMPMYISILNLYGSLKLPE